MNLLTLDHITKAYGERKLLADASFYLQEGEKTGIIGINGTGKSTLLKLAAGLEEPDAGTVTKAAHVVMRFLPQHPELNPEHTVMESVLHEYAAQSTGHDSEEVKWNIEAEAKEMLTRLGVTDMNEKAGNLSGGQKKRLALVSVLLAPADILILDEPTNHLDEEMSAWLEDYLKKMKCALLMVTHDRYFLDSVTNRIVEIDKGGIYSYKTNYSGYLELKAEREDMQAASERKRQSILRKEIEWMQRGARARSTKQKAHIERYETLRDMDAPEAAVNVNMSSVFSRLGKTTIELNGICKAYGDKKLVDHFDYIFLKDDRIGFVGPNGCGKTTLMKMIGGMIEPDAGTIERGQTVKIGYYAQEIGTQIMKAEERVIDYIRNIAEYVDTVDGKVTASQMLERFLFMGEMQYGRLGKLSGGEKRRLYLLKVLMEAPNVLILDEPTNDLDIATLRILEDYLDTFAGIVIIVSHDRYFLDRTVRRIFAFENAKLIQYEGGYTDYINKRPDREQVNAQQSGSKAEKAEKTEKADQKAEQQGNRPKKLKFTFAEQRDYETIEADIHQMEQRMDEISAEELKCTTDFVKLNALSREREELEAALDEKMQRWMYLEELAEKIANQ